MGAPGPDGGAVIERSDPAAIVIFGASGDLTQRKLIPALFTLACEGMLPEGVRVLGVARSTMTDDAFRDHVLEGVSAYGRIKDRLADHWPAFARRLEYLSGGYAEMDTYRRIEDWLNVPARRSESEGNCLFYLAIPPQVYTQVIAHLGEVKLNEPRGGWSRLIVEKPFGRDLESARSLNRIIHAEFNERQVYRIDHYLGKETVQNILTFRFANTIFEPLWNRNYVDHVQISVLESVGVEHRAGYYDQAGPVRDMMQNHLLQLLTLTAMEPPVAFNARAMRNEKVKVLQAVEKPEISDGVWGQYEGYLDEEGVAAASTTPTYLAIQMFVNNWRWQGVPFYVRTGKALSRKTTEITLQFKKVPHLLFLENADLAPNTLSLCIQPDEGMHLTFETKIPGGGMRTHPVDMDFHFGERYGDHALPEAYERLLLDALQGDASLFTRSDEIELAWGLVDPLLARWEDMDAPPLLPYPPGTSGPEAADELMKRDGREWCDCCGQHPE